MFSIDSSVWRLISFVNERNAAGAQPALGKAQGQGVKGASESLAQPPFSPFTQVPVDLAIWKGPDTLADAASCFRNPRI